METKYCIECDYEEIKKKATYECTECGEGYCSKHEKQLMGDCSQCLPPCLKRIK